jgi:hypothetical protein
MERTRHGHSHFGPRLILGLAVIAVGLILTLDNLGVLEADDLLIYWPLALVGIGLTRLFSRDATNLVFSFSLIGVGSWILMFNLGLTDLEPWGFFWPILLVIVGASLAFGSARPSVPAGADPGNTLNAFAVLGGVERQSNSPSFQGGELTAFMGGCEVDLTRARISKDDRPVIRVFALWGGIEIRVPPEWSVDARVVPLLGAYEDQTRPPAASDGPRLMIKGVVIMGGVEVKSGATEHVASDTEG